MSTVIKTEVVHMPRVKLIGRRYTDKDRNECGTFADKWGEWFKDGLFKKLKVCEGIKDVSDDFIGLIRCNGNGFEYWIGFFMDEKDVAPEGFSEVVIDEGDVFIGYIYGTESDGDIYGKKATIPIYDALVKAGYTVPKRGYEFERYNCNRFTKPDKDGKVILDYGIYIEEKKQ